MVRSLKIGKNELWWLAEGRGCHGMSPKGVHQIERRLAGKFRFIEEGALTAGLRAPQLGALHAILSAQSISLDPVTVVLPTGTGKTETMLAAYCYRPSRTLVMVPSDALRTQIGNKFATLGVLPEVGAVVGSYLTPTVGILKSRLESADQVHELFAKSCVVIATAAALSKCSTEAMEAIKSSVEQFFVDEAHHVAARTWQSVISAIGERKIVQFTATPFREDGKRIDGQIKYAYPLRLAQQNGWFANINYRAITQVGDVDEELALEAVQQLRLDLDNGYDHVLMARVKTIPRAAQVLEIYNRIAPDLLPVRIDSKLSKRRQSDAKRQLDDRETRIVVCVDMLGEGFDLPALKVAALHDPHKSLAISLQFIGRFTRSGGSTLGAATVLLPPVDGLQDVRLRRLYEEDADWNSVVRDLSQAEVEYQVELNSFEEGFDPLPTEVSIKAVRPKMSTVVYQASDLAWSPDGVLTVFGEEELLTPEISVNATERVAWFVTAEKVPVRWGNPEVIRELVYHLYVICADVDNGLLYINSSNNDVVHQELARAVGGEKVELIRGDVVYRVLGPIARRIPTNVGLLDAVNRNRRFSLLVGANVLEGFGPGAAQKSKTNIFAHGFLDQSRVSYGASRKGRIWSHRVANSIYDWVKWARSVGNTLTDESILIKDVLKGFIIPKVAVERPELVPLGVEWPHDLVLSTSETRQVAFGGKAHPIIDIDLRLKVFDRVSPIEFDVVSDDWSLAYVFEFGATGPLLRPVGDDAIVLEPRGKSLGLAEYMTSVGMTVYFEQEALLAPDGYFLQPDRSRPRFPIERLEAIDWSGINIRKESQGTNRATDSVQFRVSEVLAAEEDWELILDDDGTGEVADLVFMRRHDRQLQVLLVHCKFSAGDHPGARVGDLYEVCGQAVKSYKSKSDIEKTLQRLLSRELKRNSRGQSGFLVGSLSTLRSIISESWRYDPTVTVLVAQPGLSRSTASLQQNELLGCVDLFLSETYGSRFRVICSP